MKHRDLYEVLGVSRGDTSAEIKQAYRRLAREHHPDINPDDPAAEERFKEISAAKEVLLDDEKRKLYDEFGFEGLAAGFDPEQSRAYREWSKRAARSPADGATAPDDLTELLSRMFQQGSRGARARPGDAWDFEPVPRPGIDLESKLEVDFLDAVRGAEVRMQVPSSDAIGSSESSRNSRGKTLRVKIPAGASEGSRIRLAGQGLASTLGGVAGDLYLRLHIRAHPLYERRDDDLYLDLPVTLPELILGAEIEVPTPTGLVTMKVQPGAANGQRMRLRGKGVARAGAPAGDLFVRLVATLPDTDQEGLTEIAQQLAPLYAGMDVRATAKREGER